MKKLFCLLMALLCLASAALSEEETEQKAERVIDPTKPMIALTFDDGRRSTRSAFWIHWKNMDAMPPSAWWATAWGKMPRPSPP